MEWDAEHTEPRFICGKNSLPTLEKYGVIWLHARQAVCRCFGEGNGRSRVESSEAEHGGETTAGIEHEGGAADRLLC